MRSPRRAPLLALLGALACGLGACGDPADPGGAGRLAGRGPAGPPELLVLEGSPREMGWRQGRLLRERIRALHDAWAGDLLAAVAPRAGGGAGGQALRSTLSGHVDLCLDQCRLRLSESMLQELDGLAAGCGLDPDEVLRLEVMRDALRMKGLEPRLVGAAGLEPLPTGYEVRAWWGGADAQARGRDLLLVQRRPPRGPSSVVLAWPGSLGGLAGLRADGLGYVSAEGRVSDPRRLGFGGGRPFTIAAREALDATASVGELVAEVNGTMGHALLAFAPAPAGRLPGAQALAGFQVYSGADPPWALDREPFLALGPYESPRGGEAAQLQAAVLAQDIAMEERWLRLRAHADPEADAPGQGPWLVVRWEEGRGTLRFAASADGPVREVDVQGP